MDETDRPGSKTSPAGQVPGGEASPVDRISASLRVFLEEVSEALTEIRREDPQLTVSMKKRPDQILSLLPRILSFEQMSFLEVQYGVPGTSRSRPGIRFWLEGPPCEKRLRAILFRDTRVWDVSYDLEKLYTELASFLLREGEIVPHPAAALCGKTQVEEDWKGLLRAVLRAPLSPS